MFKKLLVANRGEIAVRVIRACREMRIASVAVYSDVDRAALHVMKADEAYAIGPSAESMELMGSKTRARQAMEKARVPFVPGTSRGIESLEEAQRVAAGLGYPVMLKAAAGGGGRG